MKNRSSMSCLAKVFLIFVVALCFGLISVVSWMNLAYGSNAGGLPACKAEPHQIFPGDGYPNPDAFGVSGHGPALSYTDNGDGTFTDNNTRFIWEIKTNTSGSVHNVDNTYTWSSTVSAADGTLFTVFLNTLNNRCSNETTTCTSDTDCTGIGNEKCGFTGHRDWRIPNVKELQSIVDYSTVSPASSVPGATAINSVYWSATTKADQLDVADIVSFGNGFVTFAFKNSNSFSARAVRP